MGGSHSGAYGPLPAGHRRPLLPGPNHGRLDRDPGRSGKTDHRHPGRPFPFGRTRMERRGTSRAYHHPGHDPHLVAHRAHSDQYGGRLRKGPCHTKRVPFDPIESLGEKGPFRPSPPGFSDPPSSAAENDSAHAGRSHGGLDFFPNPGPSPQGQPPSPGRRADNGRIKENGIGPGRPFPSGLDG